MNTAIVNVKVDPKTKKQAQKVASKLGFSLSSLINGYLKQLIKTETVVFSTSEEIPTEYMIKALKESQKDIKAGKVVSFKEPVDALDYLDKMIDSEKKSKQN